MVAVCKIQQLKLWVLCNRAESVNSGGGGGWACHCDSWISENFMQKSQSNPEKTVFYFIFKKIPLIMSRNLTYAEKNEVESRVNLWNMKEDLVVHTHT